MTRRKEALFLTPLLTGRCWTWRPLKSVYIRRYIAHSDEKKTRWLHCCTVGDFRGDGFVWLFVSHFVKFTVYVRGSIGAHRSVTASISEIN